MQPSKSHFLHRDEINIITKMSTNELNPCGIPGIFPLRMLRLSSYFFLSYFTVFAIIFIFRTFVFWGSIPYGKIIPLYQNRVVRLTPVIIAKIDSWTLGKSPRMQSWPTSACLKSCFAKWRLGNAATSSRIIGEVCCSPHYDPSARSEKGALLGMIYRVISQFS